MQTTHEGNGGWLVAYRSEVGVGGGCYLEHARLAQGEVRTAVARERLGDGKPGKAGVDFLLTFGGMSTFPKLQHLLIHKNGGVTCSGGFLTVC